MGQILDEGFYWEKNGEAAFAHKQAHVHMCITHAHMHTNAGVHTQMCTHVHTHKQPCRHVYVCVHACTRTYTHLQPGPQEPGVEYITHLQQTDGKSIISISFSELNAMKASGAAARVTFLKPRLLTWG